MAASPLFGRRPELAAIARAFEEGARVVTLFGPAGIGKTAIAREVARRTPGSVFLELEGAGKLPEPARVAIESAGEGLVVLDGATPEVVRALESDARLLVTSRARLEVEDEVVLEVGPADEPVEILVAAARRANAMYAPRAEDAPSLAEIAALLDRVPLALELAGARLPLFGARDLAERVKRDGAGLDEAVRASFDTLSAAEKDALAGLALFRGGFTVATAEEALGIAPEIVASLHARSLVRTRDAAAARFDLYARVRSHVKRVRPMPAMRERLAAWLVARAEDASRAAYVDPRARAWLLAERDNVLGVALRVVEEASFDARDAELALRALVALHPVVNLEISEAVAPIVDRTRDSGADPRFSARALLLRAALRRDRGDVRSALKDGLAAESIARAVGDELLAAEAGLDLGRTVLASGEVDAASVHFDRAARAFGVLGARGREAEALALKGALAGAVPLLERAIALADPASAPAFHLLLARTLLTAGDTSGALRAVDEAVRRDPELYGEGEILRGLALHDAGDLDGAAAAFARARDHLAARGKKEGAAIARGHLGVVARERGRAAEAYALLAEARDTLGGGDHAAYFETHLTGIAEGPPDAVHLHPKNPLAMPAVVLERILRRASRKDGTAPPDDALLVGVDGAWFRPPHGTRVGLERRRSLALLLDRLAAEREARPGAPLTSAALFAAAWPGEKAIASAAAHRVRVAVATLRKMGLRDLIVTSPEGYSLAFDRPLMRV